jgi:hypothetical protein
MIKQRAGQTVEKPGDANAGIGSLLEKSIFISIASFERKAAAHNLNKASGGKFLWTGPA